MIGGKLFDFKFKMAAVGAGAGLQGTALGGQIMACRLRNYGELFYTSPKAVFDGSAPIRGGVPVLFPQFSDAGRLPKHGLVRTREWDVAGGNDDSEFQADLTLGPNADPRWPGQAELRVLGEADEDSLEITLTIKNVGTDSVWWTGGLHPYFATTALTASWVDGLSGRWMTDRIGKRKLELPEDTPLAFDGREVEVLVHDSEDLTLVQPGRTLELSSEGFAEWMIWNPGEVGAAKIADLPPEDWQRFVCVEPVCVSRPITLDPGEEFEGRLTISVL